MDIMETVQVSNDETINQVQYPQNDFKTTSVIQNYDKMDTNTTYEHSESPYEISLPSTECNNEPIIDASIIESTENISTDYEIITPNTEENTDVEQNNEINHTETIPIEPVDTIEEHIEPLQDQVIVTNSTDNENHTVVIVTTANCTSSDVVLDSNAFIESVTEGTDVNNVVEVEECKITENTADVEKNNSDGQLDNAALSSFISEVDESVSLPPAESPILEDIPRSEEIVEKIEEEFIEKTLVVNEIEIAEAPQDTVISTSEANIQYTVLPPGENSVYQEDGTLVVEYPLHSSLDVNEEESQNSQKFIETAQTLEFVEIPQTEVQEVPAKPGKQPKPKGRKPSGNIPLHILGHNIDKPVQEVPNGKPILKPRLGVKIPYRNLSSQIVSNTELQQQIVERARQKQESQMQVDNSTTFAKKLTHRLAQSLSGLGKVGSSKRQNNLSERDSKIIAATAKTNNEEILSENAGKDVSKNSENDQNDTRNESVEITVSDNISNNNITEKTNAIEIVNVDSSNINVETSELSAGDSNLPADISNLIVETSKCTTENPDSGGKVSENKTSEPEKRSVNIETNSDLIAILEGDGDEGSPIINMPKAVEGVESVENSSELKEIEKEISLSEQKITSTPVPQIRGKKFFKSRDSRTSDAAKEKTDKGKNEETKVKTVVAENVKAKQSEIKNSPSKSDVGKISLHSNIHISKGVSYSKKTAETKKSKEENVSDKKGTNSGTIIEVEPQLKPAMVLKTYTRKRKSNDMGTPEPPKKPLITPIPMSNQPDPKIDIVPSKPPDVYITKSSRVIKKKVIWDPDEAMPSVRNQSKILSKIEATSKTTPSPKNVAAPKSTATLKISTPKVVDRKSTEKDKHIDTPKSVKPIEKRIIKSGPEDEGKNIVAIDKNAIKKPDRIEVVRKIKSPVVIKNSIVSRAKVITVKSTGAGISPVISPGKSPKKSFKRLSEIDKLLMDEGAVNMLYDINNSDEQKRRSNRTTVISTDKAQNQKELINRTQEVKNELTQGTVVETVMPKILRKKEGPPTPKKEIVGPSPIRKMSKDSSKSSVHSPPPSPAAFAMADASRIIRRHSSSSFSSNDDLVQETLADHDNKDKEKHVKKKPAAPKASSSTVEEEVAPKETVKERAVKKKTVAPQESTPRKKLKKDDSSTKNEEQEKPVEITIKSEPGNVTGELKTDPTKAFTVIKMNKHYMINLTYSGSENYLTVQLLKDLTVTLKELGRNKNCHVVSLHSQGVAFCLGLDYKGLVESNEDLRKRRATELSNCIREFLKCLLNFPKVIVAGIKGDCVGFGVTMLPLFDMIVASDSASFCTPYGKLGCAPEAGFLLSIPFQSNHGLASELLYTSHRMNADEAQRRGLVTKLFWPEKFDTEFRALMAHISNLSKVGLIATKKQLRLLHCQTTEVALANTCKTLIDFWIGEECQKNFTNYNALTFDIDQ